MWVEMREGFRRSVGPGPRTHRSRPHPAPDLLTGAMGPAPGPVPDIPGYLLRRGRGALF